MKLSARIRFFLRDWLPFFLRYQSNMNGRIDTYGIGWRRWVLYYHRKGAYGGHAHGFSWCNYFGTMEGG